MRRRRRDGFGAYGIVLLAVFGTAAMATFVLGKDRRGVYSTSEHFHRHLIADALDPITATERGLSPEATKARPGSRLTAVRAVVLRPGQIVLLAGGRQVRTIPTTRAALTLPAVVRAVDDSRWLREAGGVVTAQAALVAERGSTLLVGGPTTRTLRLARRAGVFLGARQAMLRLDSVAVQPTGRATSTNAGSDSTRPFVVALRGSRLVIHASSFRDLGHDWNSSYGVTWGSGSSGAVTDSRFERCFIAVYSARAHDLLIRGNHLRDNTLYGIDPHSHSTGIVVEGNIAEGNGRHGIIFSEHVTSSTVRDNIARGNHLNGIMMDASSSGNVITRNLVEHNRGDGIVLADSPDNAVTRNRIHANRVGVLVRGRLRQRTITHNDVSGNALAAEGTTLAGNAVDGNGDQWRRGRIWAIWLIALPLALVLSALTELARGSRDRRARRGADLSRVPG